MIRWREGPLSALWVEGMTLTAECNLWSTTFGPWQSIVEEPRGVWKKKHQSEGARNPLRREEGAVPLMTSHLSFAGVLSAVGWAGIGDDSCVCLVFLMCHCLVRTTVRFKGTDTHSDTSYLFQTSVTPSWLSCTTCTNVCSTHSTFLTLPTRQEKHLVEAWLHLIATTFASLSDKAVSEQATLNVANLLYLADVAAPSLALYLPTCPCKLIQGLAPSFCGSCALLLTRLLATCVYAGRYPWLSVWDHAGIISPRCGGNKWAALSLRPEACRCVTVHLAALPRLYCEIILRPHQPQVSTACSLSKSCCILPAHKLFPATNWTLVGPYLNLMQELDASFEITAISPLNQQGTNQTDVWLSVLVKFTKGKRGRLCCFEV